MLNILRLSWLVHWIQNHLGKLKLKLLTTRNFLVRLSGRMYSKRKIDYSRLSLEELEKLKPKVLETYRNGKYSYSKIARENNIEQGLLMLLVSGNWDNFKIYYEANTVSNLYRSFTEYKDSVDL